MTGQMHLDSVFRNNPSAIEDLHVLNEHRTLNIERPGSEDSDFE